MAVLLLGVLGAWAALAGTPWDVLPQSICHDLKTHTELVAAAADAQREGQWPLRELPRVASAQDPVFIRYPVFQFYSVLPYTVAAVMVRGGLRAYHSLLLAVGLSFGLGFVAFYYLGRQQGLAWDAALAGAVLFTSAPYHLSDWYGRFAFPELIAFGLLPLLWLATRWAAREGRLVPVLAAAVAWAALILTHNIFHIYGAALLLPLTIWQAPAGRRLQTAGSLAAAYGLACMLCAWYLVPLAQQAPQFLIAHGEDPFLNRRFAPLWVLLGPILSVTPEVMALSPLLGAQVGWGVLAGALAYAASRVRPTGQGPRGGLGAFFILSLFMAWSPVDLWSRLGPLRVIQYPYRLLMFTSLFGALMGAEAWQRWSGPAAGGTRRGLALAALSLVLVGLGSTYELIGSAHWPVDAPEKFYQEAGVNLRTGYVYHFAPDPAGPAMASNTLPVSLALSPRKPFKVTLKSGLVTTIHLSGLEEPGTVLLPAPWYPALYQVRVNGQVQPPLRSSNRLAVEVPMGPVEIAYRFTGLPWANALSALGAVLWGALALFSLYQWRAVREEVA